MKKMLSALFLLLTLTACGGPANVTGNASSGSGLENSTAPLDPMAGWKEYMSDKYWLTLKIPPGYVASDASSSTKKKAVSSAAKVPSGGRPLSYDTITFASPDGPPFALTVYRGVNAGVSIADMTYDPRCGAQGVDTIKLMSVYVKRNIRFVERRVEKAGMTDVDFCFLNRQHYVLALHAWGVSPEQAEAVHALLRQVSGTITLTRGAPSSNLTTRGRKYKVLN